MKMLGFISTSAVVALGPALAPAAFARGGGGGGGHGGGFGGHVGGVMAGHAFAGGYAFAGHFGGGGHLAHFRPHGARPVYGPGGIFYGYDLGYGFGMAYPGYVSPLYCAEYPQGYMPEDGCYWPYTG